MVLSVNTSLRRFGMQIIDHLQQRASCYRELAEFGKNQGSSGPYRIWSLCFRIWVVGSNNTPHAVCLLILLISGLVWVSPGEIVSDEYGFGYWSSLVVFLLCGVCLIASVLAGFFQQRTRRYGLIGLSIIASSGLITMFSSAYYILGLNDADGCVVKEEFWTSIYVSVVTWTTLGYGDFTPTTPSRSFAASEAMLGYIVTPILIALLIKAQQNKD